ncbi:hypothetical protein ABAC460_01535 [Asticcacaulis sp. AC460]|uniref:hypothetical protein n=1 Tax=Asticcacaulis sp. AC460 TaxID=1282360 RepID=UPI0003C3C9F8|nr:hypothetical protein [Asticcacaulis sp. AC460]ESQ92958.1 hypothetical protein ABAC460_01535 [Asticcacaulis sp. AC460]
MSKMRGRCAALMAAVMVTLAPAAAQAQDNSAAMTEVVRQMRETATKMEGQLPAEDIAEMRRSADEIEAQIKAGAFNTAAPVEDPNDVTGRLMREHGGIVDWLENETACAGYSWETYKTYRLDTGDRDGERDVLCQKAYAHYERYFYLGRDGKTAEARVELEAYDVAAHAAVDFYEKR